MATAENTDEPSPIEDACDELQTSIPKAATSLTDLLDAEDERVQIRAAKVIIDRAGITKADSYDIVDAQVQIDCSETSGRGVRRTYSQEDGEDDDTF